MTTPSLILKSVLCSLFMLSVTSPVSAEQLYYELDKKLSSVRILVYKQGALQWFGHNHVISHTNLKGSFIKRTSNIADNEFTLTMSVKDFVVDDKQQRHLSGDAFISPVDSEDAQATRDNMLGQEMLDEQHFHHISITGSLTSLSSDQAEAQIQILLKGVRKQLSVPINLQLSDTKLTGSGRFSVKQSDFKIQAFSLMGGLLAVQDPIDIVFEFIANRSENIPVSSQ